MSDAAAEWLRKAELDLDGVRRALLPVPHPNPELGAYHCQQAAEKLVKALLVSLGLVYPRGGLQGHDIGLAARRIPPRRPSLQARRPSPTGWNGSRRSGAAWRRRCNLLRACLRMVRGVRDA